MKSFLRRFVVPLFSLLAAAALIAAGVKMGEHSMIFSHAIVVCLSCIGLG